MREYQFLVVPGYVYMLNSITFWSKPKFFICAGNKVEVKVEVTCLKCLDNNSDIIWPVFQSMTAVFTM